MAKHHEPKHGHERGHERDHEHRSDHDRDHDHKDSGDDPKRHAKIIERRWLESPPPTFEHYSRALRQWHALSGAVVRPATDLTGGDDKSKS